MAFVVVVVVVICVETKGWKEGGGLISLFFPLLFYVEFLVDDVLCVCLYAIQIMPGNYFPIIFYECLNIKKWIKPNNMNANEMYESLGLFLFYIHMYIIWMPQQQ